MDSVDHWPIFEHVGPSKHIALPKIFGFQVSKLDNLARLVP